MKRLILLMVILLAAAMNASAIQMDSNGNGWFLPDGRIIQTKRVLTESGSESPGLLCYNQNAVEAHGNGVCIELNMQNNAQTAHSLLFVDAAEEIVKWEYRLDTAFPVSAYAGNKQGGLTLFVQKDAANERYELEMITLDANGTEISRVKVEEIPATMAVNVVSEQ